MIALIGYLGWLILLVIVIAFMCCIMPWWLVLLVIVVSIISALTPWNQPFIDRSKAKKYKSRLEKQKENKANKNKQSITTSNTSTRVNRTNANIGAGTYYQKNDDFDYDKYIAAKREEQAAYDDFIASMDMDD